MAKLTTQVGYSHRRAHLDSRVVDEPEKQSLRKTRCLAGCNSAGRGASYMHLHDQVLDRDLMTAIFPWQNLVHDQI